MTPTTQSKVKLAKAYVLGWVGHEFAEDKLCHCLVTAASHVLLLRRIQMRVAGVCVL